MCAPGPGRAFRRGYRHLDARAEAPRSRTRSQPPRRRVASVEIVEKPNFAGGPPWPLAKQRSSTKALLSTVVEPAPSLVGCVSASLVGRGIRLRRRRCAEGLQRGVRAPIRRALHETATIPLRFTLRRVPTNPQRARPRDTNHRLQASLVLDRAVLRRRRLPGQPCQQITLWNVSEGRRVASGPRFSHASSADFSPDGTLLAVKNTSGDVLVLSVPDLEEVSRLSGAGLGEGTPVRFAEDGKHIVDATWDGALMVRDALDGSLAWSETGESVFRLERSRDRAVWTYDRASWPVVRAQMAVRRARARTDRLLRRSVLGRALRRRQPRRRHQLRAGGLRATG